MGNLALKLLGLGSLGSIATGACYGFCNAKSIPIDSEGLEFALKWGPTLAGGTLGATGGALYGLVDDVVLAGLNRNFTLDTLLGKYAKKLDFTGASTVIGAISGSAKGAITGGLGTLIGYGLGYAVGCLG